MLVESGLEMETMLGVERSDVVGSLPVFSLQDLEEFKISFTRLGQTLLQPIIS